MERVTLFILSLKRRVLLQRWHVDIRCIVYGQWVFSVRRFVFSPPSSSSLLPFSVCVLGCVRVCVTGEWENKEGNVKKRSFSFLLQFAQFLTICAWFESKGASTSIVVLNLLLLSLVFIFARSSYRVSIKNIPTTSSIKILQVISDSQKDK